MRFAVSYIRFSTLEQRFGDSKRRQLERTEKFCQKHGLVLDKRLSDEGLSAFKGKHRSLGTALAIFLKLIDEGKVPKGTVFVIESLGRLTRESIPEALELFLGILRKGIDVVTLIDEQWYTSAKLAVDPSQLMMSIVCFWRAHDESKHKELDQHASRLVKLARSSSGPIREVTMELDTIEKDRGELRKQGGKLKSDIAAKKGFSVTEGIDLLRELAADRAKPESRVRLRGEIRRYVERIELFRTFPNALFEDTTLPTLKPGLAVKDFLHARCLRIVFRNGAERWVVLRGEMDGFGLRIEGRKFSRDDVLRTENPGGQFLMPAIEDREVHAREGKMSMWKKGKI
jgi:DNA invertase Pin-like site-specific DNA recombinase